MGRASVLVWSCAWRHMSSLVDKPVMRKLWVTAAQGSAHEQTRCLETCLKNVACKLVLKNNKTIRATLISFRVVKAVNLPHSFFSSHTADPRSYPWERNSVIGGPALHRELPEEAAQFCPCHRGCIAFLCVQKDEPRKTWLFGHSGKMFRCFDFLFPFVFCFCFVWK